MTMAFRFLEAARFLSSARRLTSLSFLGAFTIFAASACAPSEPAQIPQSGEEVAKAKTAQPSVAASESESLLLSGQYEAVLQLKSTEASSGLDQVRALRRLGRLDEALSRLDGFQGSEARLMRAEILFELGRREEAENECSILVQDAGQVPKVAKGNKERHEAQMRLARAGRAAHLLREAETANAFFNQAEQLGVAPLELLLWRAALFIEKHDLSHAEEIVLEADERFGEHPEVLLLGARFLLERSLAFQEADDLASQVLKKNPHHTGALAIFASNALRDLDFSQAEAHIDRGLKINARDLELLSLRAASRFLAEDPKGFEESVEHFHELSPGNVEIFRIVADHAEWEHRYPDIEKLMRRAARLDRKDAHVRAKLGLTLVRAGSDAAGVVELNRAYDLDPYNVRVVNTLRLYEENIAELYVDSRRGPFKYRFPKAEAELLERYVPGLLEEAHRKMVERYRYTPQAPIGIEIYSSRDEFAVRTSGLPQTPIQGVCFGRKLATMSPVGSPGNLGMTLWHELAHVFHLGLSKNRTPRWFTEGMAEWETAVRGVGWSRELDLELVQALRADTLPPLAQMSRAFTHARHMSEVATAYYASGLLLEWIVASRGQASAVEVLHQLGKKRLPLDVLTEVLGAPTSVLDTQFRAWLDLHLKRFDKTFTSRHETTPSSELEEQLSQDKKSPVLRLRLGLSLLAEGNRDRAHSILSQLNKEDFNPQASFALARLALASEDKKTAQSLLEEMFEQGIDGYELRMMHARLFFTMKKESEAEQQLRAAIVIDPEAEEPWSMLASLYLKNENREAELEALQKWARLSEHDAFVHRRLIELLLSEERFKEAVDAGRLAIWTDLAGSETHLLYGLALARSGDLRNAEFEWESALLTPLTLESEAKLQATWLGELKRRGQSARAQRVKTKIEKGRAARLKKSGAPVL